MLILKEHAILTLGNLIFDSATLFTAAVSHKLVANTGESRQIGIGKLIIDLIHFKRSQLTYACLWTLNNLMNYQSEARKGESIADELLASGIGSALKVVHSCYRYARDKAKAEKNTLFKYMTPASASDESGSIGHKEVIQELYWFYNYYTGCGPLYSGFLLKQCTELLQFAVEDIVKLS